jgi:hypothetical protein
MSTPTEILMQSLIPNRTPPGGVVRSVGAMPSIVQAGVMPQAAPAAPAAPQLSPTAKYIADMQALMSGGIGQLSTGEKISALGQVLQAAGSRGASDPAAVLQGVRKQQMDKLNAQYQIAQLQQKTQQEAKQRAFIQQYASSLPEAKRGVLENADPAEAFKIVQEETFRPKQVLKHVRDAASGMMRIEFQDGSSQLTDRPMPRNTEDRDIGGAIQVIDKDTGVLVATIPKTMAPGEASRLNLAERQFAFEKSKPPSGGGGSEPSFQILNTTGGYVGVNRKNLTQQVPLGLQAPAAANIFSGILPPPTGKRTFK